MNLQEFEKLARSDELVRAAVILLDKEGLDELQLLDDDANLLLTSAQKGGLQDHPTEDAILLAIQGGADSVGAVYQAMDPEGGNLGRSQMQPPRALIVSWLERAKDLREMDPLEILRQRAPGLLRD